MVQGAMVLMRGVQIGSLYKLLGRRDTNGCVNIVTLEVNEISSCLVNLTMLWHRQMGHIREKSLRAMHNKGMVDDFPNCLASFDLCEHCINGKQNCVSLPYGATRVKGFRS